MDFFLKLLGKAGRTELTDVINKGAFLVDVRTPAEFMAGTAIGAVNIPLDDLHNHLEAFEDKENIVLFCKSGFRSGRAKEILEENGFQNIINGGTWQNVNRAVSE